MNLSYKNILLDAWKITWKNKVLWIFGIFASFISLEAVYEVILGQISQVKKIEAFNLGLLNFSQKRSDFLSGHVYALNNLTNDFSSYIYFIIMLVAVLFFVWLVLTSQIFIIKAVAKLSKNKNIVLSDDLLASYDKFWPVLGINVIIKLALYAGYIILSLPLIYSLLVQQSSTIIAANIFFFVLYTIFAIGVSFISAYAINFIILNNLHIFDAIREAWKLFAKNISLSLEIAFILFLLKLISIIIIFSLSFLGFIPLVFVFLLNLSSQNIIGIVMSLTLMFFLFSIVSLLINTIFTSFYLSTWTLTFIKLTENDFYSKLSIILRKIPTLLKRTAKKYDVKIDKNKLKSESKKLAQDLKTEYIRIKPIAKKQSKVALEIAKETYNKIEPKLEKEIQKIISEVKKSRKTTTKKIKPKKK